MSIELHKIYKRKKNDRDIFQELMPFKIKEILLIANYYDAYTIEREGQFTDKIVGEYLQVNLYTAPRFTSVASEAEALKILSERHIDLIISFGHQPSSERFVSEYLSADAGKQQFGPGLFSYYRRSVVRIYRKVVRLERFHQDIPGHGQIHRG